MVAIIRNTQVKEERQTNFSAPYKGFDDISSTMKDVEEILGDRKFKTIYMPEGRNLQPFWRLNPDRCYANSTFGPEMATMAVIRDYPNDFFGMVHGTYIESLKDYNEVFFRFNKLWLDVDSGKGNGYLGLANEDEFITLGSLFYILAETCLEPSIKADGELKFLNKWSEEPKLIELASNFYKCSSLLKKCSFSNFQVVNFLQRYLEKSDEDSLWFYNLGDISNYQGEDLIQLWLTLERDLMRISNKGSGFMATIQVSKEKGHELIAKQLNMEQSSEDSFFSNSLRMRVKSYAQTEQLIFFKV